MVSIRIPDVDVKIRLFGGFTPTDLVRFSLPTLVVGGAGYAPAVAPIRTLGFICGGALLGLLWSTITWEGKPIDHHLIHAVSWLVCTRFTFDRSWGDTHPSVTHDHLKNDTGVAAVIEVTPTELSMKSAEKQKALHRLYQRLLDGIDAQIEVHSVQLPLDLSTYINKLDNHQQNLDGLLADYRQYCQALNTGDILQTRHFIVVRAQRISRQSLRQRLWDKINVGPSRSKPSTARLTSSLDDRCRLVEQQLNASDLEARRLSGSQLKRAADQLVVSGECIGKRPRYSRPEGIWQRTIALTDLPRTLPLGWPLSILRVEAPVHLTQIIGPEPPGKTVKKLQRLRERAAGELTAFAAAGYLRTNRLEHQEQDIQWMLELLTNRTDTPVRHGSYVTIRGSDRPSCDDGVKRLTERLDSMQIDYREPVFQQAASAQTTSLYPGTSLDDDRLMPSRSAAAGFPFGTAHSSYRSGVVYGRDSADGTPILLDRFTWSSHSMAVMGMTGSGKSYLAKLELLRSYLAFPDIQIAVFDPKKEYRDFVKALGGVVTVQDEDRTEEVMDFSPEGFRPRIASYEVPERGQANDAAVLLNLLREVYSMVSTVDCQTLVFIDEARILLNDPEGKNVLNRFVLEARDTETAITMITQNASHFTHSRQGREILDNVPGKLLMHHDRVSDPTKRYFRLSNEEVQQLYSLKTGTDCRYSEGLLKVSNRLDTKLRIEATDTEHEIVDR